MTKSTDWGKALRKKSSTGTASQDQPLPLMCDGEGMARATINLTVTEAEKREFKSWCAMNGISQIAAFREGFRLLKATKGK